MIELMLQAERNLAMGLVDQAERLYRQVLERDPRNAIAVVGLARVAIARDDDRAAYALAIDALRIDPQNAAAIKLEGRLAEVFAERGEPFEREPFAVRLAQAESERAEEYLRSAARSAPQPTPGRPDYAPTLGTRFEQVIAAERSAAPSAPARALTGSDGADPAVAAGAAATAAPASTEAAAAREQPISPGGDSHPAAAPVERAPEPEERPGLLKRLFGFGRTDK